MRDLQVRLFIFHGDELQYEAWGNTLEVFRHELPSITAKAAIIGYHELAVNVSEDVDSPRYVSHIFLEVDRAISNRPSVPANERRGDTEGGAHR